MTPPARPSQDRLFADLVLEQGLCTREKVDECLSLIARLVESGVTPVPNLGEILLRKGYLTPNQVHATMTLHAPGAPSPKPRDVHPLRGAPLPPEVQQAERNAANRIGKYVRVAPLGMGGMGEVWKGWDRELARWVALKFLHHPDPDQVARFRREAQTAAALNHPNIAGIYEVGEILGKPFIAMQFVQGQTLSSFPRKDARLLVELLRDAALAIHHAHEQKVIHRDLKPANLMVETSAAKPRVYVMDFGLAKPTSVESSLSVSGAVLGTPAYMPPEQARGEIDGVSARSDVYSLGATLYELLADRPPFQGKEVYALLQKVVEGDPAPLRRIRPSVDRDLETIVTKCLEKDPARRYASARELADDLTRWLAGEMILAHPPSTAYRVRKFLARRKALVAMAAAGLVAVGLSLALFVPRWLAEKAQAAELRELGELRTQMLVVKEWTRQAFRKPQEIRRALERETGQVTGFIGRHPGRLQGYYVRAQGRLSLGDLKGAERDLAEAVGIDGGFAPALALLARVKLEGWARLQYEYRPSARREREKENLVRDAAELLERVRRAGSGAIGVERWGLSRTREDDLAETLSRAMTSYVEKRKNDALAVLEAEHRKSPSEECCTWLAIWAGAGPQQLKWLDDALSIAPHFAPAYLYRGMVLARRGRAAEAILDYTRAIEIDPHLSIAYVERGNARGDGDPKGAIEDFTEALRLDPADVVALHNRGLSRHALEDLEGALRDFDRAIELDPELSAAWSARGAAQVERGDRARALADCAKALELDPRNSEAHTARGMALEDDDPKRAMEEFSRAIDLGTKKSVAYVHRAYLWAAEGQDGPAIADLNRAIELKHRHPEAYASRAFIHNRRKEYAEAVTDATEAIRIDARYPDGYHNRAAAYANLRKLDLAIADFRKALEVAPADWPFRQAARESLQKAERALAPQEKE